jgi:sporulation protein YlmC with PRC-barrel domain
MRAIHSYLVAVTLAAGVALASYIAQAEQPGETPRNSATDNQARLAEQNNGGSVLASKTYRAEKLKGMKVRNPEGEDLGTIEDLVLDLESHRLRYAALSYGGFLGVGDKLFAIPIEALRLKHEGDKSYFIADIDKETLKNAPGFAKNAWPDFGDPAWVAGMEKHYGRYETIEGTVQSTTGGKLKVQDEAGQEQEFNIGPTVKIVSNGGSAKLDDLREGQRVKITTTERDGKRVASSVQAEVERTAQKPSERPATRK